MHSIMQQPFKNAVLILVWGWLLFLVLAPNLLVVGASVMTLVSVAAPEPGCLSPAV